MVDVLIIGVAAAAVVIIDVLCMLRSMWACTYLDSISSVEVRQNRRHATHLDFSDLDWAKITPHIQDNYRAYGWSCELFSAHSVAQPPTYMNIHGTFPFSATLFHSPPNSGKTNITKCVMNTAVRPDQPRPIPSVFGYIIRGGVMIRKISKMTTNTLRLWSLLRIQMTAIGCQT